MGIPIQNRMARMVIYLLPVLIIACVAGPPWTYLWLVGALLPGLWSPWMHECGHSTAAMRLSLGACWRVVESLYGVKGFLEPPWAGRGSNASDSYPRVGRF